jgi:hypothetical protein
MATISEEMYVVLIARKMSYTDTGSPTYSDYLGMFGTIVNGKPYQDYFGHKRPFFPASLPINPNITPCYVIGKVRITAGVIRNSPGTRILSKTSSEIRFNSSKQFEPDRWVEQAFQLLPDVLSKIGDVNITAAPRWDNLDGYIKSTIQTAYTATWTAMDQKFRKTDPQLTIYKPV